MRKFLIILLLVQGCAFLKEKPFHKVIVMPETIVHLRENCDDKAGWASGNEVCVWGYQYKGQIIPDYTVLGHEIAHRLNNIDAQIKNPDEIRSIKECQLGRIK